MKILAFAASPRKGGNTEILLDKVIDGLRVNGADVDKISTHDLDIRPCNGCGVCESLGYCVIKDAFQGIYERLVECDGMLFASPLYFMNVPSHGKALIDRCQVFWTAKYRRNDDQFKDRKRAAMLISCSGARSGPNGASPFRGIEDTMTYFFDALGMKKIESLLYSKTDAKAEILNNSNAMDEALEKAKELYSFLLP